MTKVLIKAPAKINFTIDVSGVENGFHLIKSFVATINLCDKLTFKRRKDDKVVIYDRGGKCCCPPEKNNAYKAAVAFIKEFSTCGVDIYIDKKIPVGGGLGGSSADIAGTLLGLKKLYSINSPVTSIANALGSDSGYLLEGGFKVISGRGENIERSLKGKTLYLLIIKDDKSISAKECYQKFDEEEETPLPITDRAVELFINGDKEFYSVIKNDLYAPALCFLPTLKEKILDLENAGAIKALMTGSGSCVYGIFESKKERDKAKKILKGKYKKDLIKANT